MLFMIKRQKDLLTQPKTNPRYRITASLLNSWQRIFDASLDLYYNEETSEISYEEALQLEKEKRFNEFVNVLKRIPIEDNDFMRKGREFETKVCDGLDECFSPYVKNGAFQVTVTKDVDIDGVPITLYGVLDVLKKGRIMDIKRIFSNYKYPKYATSHQHPLYMFLVPNAIDFTYLICDKRIDGVKEETRKKAYNLEHYTRENCEDILEVCSNFIDYLKQNNLFEIFIEKWQMK